MTVAIRNWRQITPVVSHHTAIVYAYFGWEGQEGKKWEQAPLRGFQALTLHIIQPGKSGDYHIHFDREQIYYFTQGSGKMNVDDKLYNVKKGDVLCVPIGSYHQMINDTDDWLAHLIMNGRVVSPEEQEVNKKKIAAKEFKNVIAHRNWLDSDPGVSHGAALLWSVFGPLGQEGKTYNEAPATGVKKITLHRLQPGLQTGTHDHADMEQVYYFTSGKGKMIVGNETIPVRDGDAVYGPAKVQHGLINDSDDWLEHLIISAEVGKPIHPKGKIGG